MKRTTKRMFIMLLCVVLLIAVLALGKFLQIRKLIASMPKPGAQVVTAMKAEMLEWQPQFNAVGTLNPVRGVDVTTEVAGLVRSLHFHSGQDVKAGELLVELNADSDIAQLQALQAAADLSASVLARDRQQFEVKAISQAQLDADQADLRVKRASVAQQAALVAKKTIRAPFSGRLGITTVNPGQYLNPGDKIVTLQTLNPIYIDFNLPQKQLAGVSLGQRLTLSSDAFPGQSFAGKITAINPKVDPTTRNLQLEATIANEKLQLLPGMFANVDVDAGDKKSYLTLPQTAITYNPYGSTVFVLKPGDKKDDKGNAQLEAQQVFVTTGPTRGDQVAVLTGLTAGQQIVTSGQLKLKNGSPVTVDNSVQPANSPNPTPQEK
ncbi:efflux RND transporter periplasmic adaptor subunit [Polaromonas sp. C04]|uniref:efflux RND transporter periplasmic adaptor subunit n=1 Tax=Polaromonas sp. C04 TaxID=1945857 RepID=UPI0009CD98AF|nr:efflux RND transporter periplasmic adaptor subunit [Polaromonas sp. C04]OOG49694.1 efflux transporter periplasmic adaptor subunit [Polaromonas sp. C04]